MKNPPMKFNRFSIMLPVSYIACGNFKAPNPQWKHEHRLLFNFELILVTEGTLYLQVEDVRYSIPQGQYILIQPFDYQHQSKQHVEIIGWQPSQCSYCWLHFSTPFHDFCTPLHTDFLTTDHYIHLPVQYRVPNLSRLLIFLRQLQSCMRAPYQNYIDYGNYLTTMLICELYNQFLTEYTAVNHLAQRREEEKKTLPVPVQTNAHGKRLYHDIADYIQLHLSDILKVRELTGRFGYSAKYLNELFKQHTGHTLKQYILQAKMEYASFLLLDSNSTIQHIAAGVGFQDSHNFTRSFRLYMGMSPTEYRNAFPEKVSNYQ